jgi:membrane protein DedA with SNARE-associated domain
VVSRLLHPLLSLHGWEAYLLIGFLVFAEAAIMLGFVFPGETAAILGGVLAASGGVSIEAVVILVVVCAIIGDSVGYVVGTRWGRPLLQLGPLRRRQRGIARALLELSRRGALAVFVARFSAFLRAVVPGLAGMSDMHYRTFLLGNATGGLVWGVLYTLLGYFVGQRVEAATGVASYVVLGLIVAAIVVFVIRGRLERRKELGAAPDATVATERNEDQSSDESAS